VNANYEMGTAPNGQEYEKRGSIQSFSNGEYKKCTDQAKMFPTLTDDAKAFQCYAMYQWTNGEPPEAGDDPTIDLCVWDGDNKQCVADPDYSNILFTESAVQDLNCSY
jgi:hypothetical protein